MIDTQIIKWIDMKLVAFLRINDVHAHVYIYVKGNTCLDICIWNY